MKNILIIDNPSNLPLLSLDNLHHFQGDLKHDPSEEHLDKFSCRNYIIVMRKRTH